MLGVINYGSGNFQSVCNALAFENIAYKAINTADDFTTVTHIILPGVGSYKDCMTRLNDKKLLNALLHEVNNKNKFFLGICVGHQILSTIGTEFEEVTGTGLIPGKTTKLTPSTRLPIPHIGWSEVYYKKSPLFQGIEDGSTFYFVHSYHIEADNNDSVLATYEYGQTVTAAVNCGNIYGVQFHPEKSQGNGLKLLKNFAQLS